MKINNTIHFITTNPNLKNTIRRLSSVYLLLIIIVSTASYVYFQSIKKIMIKDSENNLSIVAELKVNQITNWRQERLDDAFSLEPYYIDAAKVKTLTKTDDKILRQKLFCKWTRDIHKNPEYEGIYLYDTSLKLITFGCNGGDNLPLGKFEAGQAFQAIETQKTIFSDLYRNEFNNSIDLNIYVPVFETSTKGTKVFGLLVLKINPDKFLYPLIQSVPGKSKSLETYIVREKDGNALFLNELKYSKNSALSLMIPAGKERYPDAVAVKGVTGITEGRDYRGVPVLASVRKIPDTTWVLTAKIDKSELDAPVKERALYVVLLAVFFVVGLGAWLGFLWYGQLVAFYKKQYASEAEHRALTRKYDYLIKYANDIIIMLNKDLQIVEANEKAVNTYKFSRGELTQMNFRDLQSPQSVQEFNLQLEVVANRGNKIFKTMHRHKDGSTFPVEVSMQHFVIEWNEYYQVIIRDISERNTWKDQL